MQAVKLNSIIDLSATTKNVCRFKESYYNIKHETLDCILLYNTRTGAFVAIPKEFMLKAKEILKDPDSYRTEKLFSGLYEHGFIVDSCANEFEEIKDRFFKAKSNSKLFYITILASENCNFRCPYCFIYERRGFNMEKWVYEAILKYIKKTIPEGAMLMIYWFGGEPTLAKDDILRFMSKVTSLTREKGIGFKSKIVTNGYLLNYLNFRDYLHSGISDFQITIGAGEKSHDRTRFLKNGKGTFRTIWNNLIDIKKNAGQEKFSVMLRVTFLNNQDEEINDLSKNFLKEFYGDKRFSIYFKPVYAFETKHNEVQTLSSEILKPESAKIQQLKYTIRCMGLLESHLEHSAGTSIIPNPVNCWCLAEKDNAFIVAADGNITKCDTYIGDLDKFCGKLDADGNITMNNKKFEWDFHIYNECFLKCRACKYLPICQGGCPRGRKERIANGKCYYDSSIIKDYMLEYHKLISKFNK